MKSFATKYNLHIFIWQVTCGSVVKLQNIYHKIRLHSHDVKYGSGSGQQSVTGTEVKEDVNSHWAIKGKCSKSASIIRCYCCSVQTNP